ncbi:MAG: MmcQ/YjbR family DNA-binding protein [Bacteroidales bacterium]|nr:MmcQ/YjbR family DNA-binding protein [Bacteroidales bacterium]
MNIEEIRQYCLSKKGVNESFPFDETTLVFKVISKIFALTSLDRDFGINLKCDPEKAIQLRERHSYVVPGYHMNKKHWNSVRYDLAGNDELMEWIDHSYDLVKNSLTKKEQALIK